MLVKLLVEVASEVTFSRGRTEPVSGRLCDLLLGEEDVGVDKPMRLRGLKIVG